MEQTEKPEGETLPTGTFAQRLKWLFDKYPYTFAEIARIVNARMKFGIGISAVYIGELVQGGEKVPRGGPRVGHIRALADAFGVPVSYLLPDEAPEAEVQSGVDAACAPMDELRDAGVMGLHFRATSPKSDLDSVVRDLTAVVAELQRQIAAIQSAHTSDVNCSNARCPQTRGRIGD